MKHLVILWDPENPLVPVAPVVKALGAAPGVRTTSLTFREIGHETLPNRAFELRPALGASEPSAILWIEGGPLPRDLAKFSCPKACWLVNTHLEPSLMGDFGSAFDRVFVASMDDAAGERATWLPLSAGSGDRPIPPKGVSLLIDDPLPPEHARLEQELRAATELTGHLSTPVVVCLGNGGRAHPMLFEALRSGAAVVTDGESDIRGIAYRGQHLEICPSSQSLPEFVGQLLQDAERLTQLAAGGPRIVEHLHRPDHRATEICRGIWPEHRILSGAQWTPRVSVLVTCYRYLKRFRFCLESLARQRLPEGSLEIVVADPGSPDGLSEFLKTFALQHPGVSVVHLPVDPVYHRNRGVGINRAFDASRAPVVIGIDGDLVFPEDLVAFLESRVLADPGRVYGVRRAFVGRSETEAILRGELDPFTQFDRLSTSDGDGESMPFVGVLGYCQAVHRSAFAKSRYPEELDMVNQSDIEFVDRLAKHAGVRPCFLQDQVVLHLWHPRNWSGTTESL